MSGNVEGIISQLILESTDHRKHTLEKRICYGVCQPNHKENIILISKASMQLLYLGSQLQSGPYKVYQ